MSNLTILLLSLGAWTVLVVFIILFLKGATLGDDDDSPQSHLDERV